MITTTTTRVLAVLALLALGASATACATVPVQAWQRGRLSKTWMQFSPDPGLTAYSGHWQESREGAAGGLGLQGGGCGCK